MVAQMILVHLVGVRIPAGELFYAQFNRFYYLLPWSPTLTQGLAILTCSYRQAFGIEASLLDMLHFRYIPRAKAENISDILATSDL